MKSKPALELGAGAKQENCHEFKSSLGYRVRRCLKQQQNKEGLVCVCSTRLPERFPSPAPSPVPQPKQKGMLSGHWAQGPCTVNASPA